MRGQAQPRCQSSAGSGTALDGLGLGENLASGPARLSDASWHRALPEVADAPTGTTTISTTMDEGSSYRAGRHLRDNRGHPHCDLRLGHPTSVSPGVWPVTLLDSRRPARRR